ncbi:MAG: sigma-54 dependent transcriptional regulator [Bacteroidales bacterium]|nr:sigma-54 dependent transcriptional regulator [Bacteroidales bacterium]
MNDQNNRILIVDDDEHIHLSLKVLLEPEFGEISCIKNPDKIPEMLKENSFDAILLDMNYAQGETSGDEGMYWLKQILSIDPESNVLLITAYGDLNIAVTALKHGAIDFIVKPWNNEKLLATINSTLKLSRNKKEIKNLKSKQKALITALESDLPELIGKSQIMKDLYNLINKVAITDANVLIQGENGTGKELVARALHKKSLRSKNPFINVDLGAISETLFESEMFGHKKGSFTDAKEDRAGRFEAGNGGTVFLDEIGNLPLAMQSKLLSVIQNREVYSVGSMKALNIDVRLICASNISLRNAVEQNNFRQDLLYRINTVEITMPALRERREDIPLLANYFIEKYCKKYRRNSMKLPDYVERKLQKYDWPGNIRELQHSIERAIILSSESVLKSSDFDFLERKDVNDNPFDNYDLENLEKWAISNCLKKHSGNVSRAATELGLTRGALYRRIEKYGV